MEKKFFILLSVFIFSSLFAFSQSNDFCYNSKDTSLLIGAVCFEQTMGNDIEFKMSKTLNPNTLGVRISKDNTLYDIPNSYVITQYDDMLKGVTRVCFDISKNSRIILACLPWDRNNDINYVQIAMIIVIDGESQLLTNEVCKKEKFKAGQNISLYKITPHVNSIKTEQGELKWPIDLYFKDGQKLIGLNINDSVFTVD